MLNRSKLWAVTLLIAFFAAGAAVGGPGWNALNGDSPEGQSRRGDDSESRGRGHKSFSEHLQEDLSLTVDQRAAVDSILTNNQAAMREAWSEMRTRLDTLRQNVSNEIELLLDEEQAVKFRELMERSKRRGDRERAPRDNRNHE